MFFILSTLIQKPAEQVVGDGSKIILCSYKNEPYTPPLFCRGSNGLKGFSSVSLLLRHFHARGDTRGSSHLEL